ncbi:hypothetical protein NAPIS_ORF00444 [Vairimorpha apis BRL 01]|uniref:Uncharacterized protein n=1 Tax=Vairimorpha apis BRL 01 TaxID=1037528 RepID=T0LCF6_9MICR|nr:hypothetical protein NAPIS_ORF00444 [Vairimorpha apis BRL 01]
MNIIPNFMRYYCNELQDADKENFDPSVQQYKVTERNRKLKNVDNKNKVNDDEIDTLFFNLESSLRKERYSRDM